MPLRRMRHLLWAGSTAEVELWLGLAIGLRGLWMLWPGWDSIPLEVQGYLIPGGLPEWGYGLLLLACGVGQLASALYQWPTGRALTAAVIAAQQSSVLVGYGEADYLYRAVVPFIVVIALGEWWLSWRAWTEQLHGGHRTERRWHG